MSRGTALRLCVGLLAFAGCRDDFNAMDDGGSGGDGDNMLGNASFEQWTGDNLEVWAGEGATLTRSDDANAGMYAVEVAGDTYASIGQGVSKNLPLPAGTCLRVGADLKWISGASQAPAFLLNVTYDDDTEDLLGEELGWVADGEWHEPGGVIETSATIKSMAISIGSGSAVAQTYLVDDALLRIEDCGG